MAEVVFVKFYYTVDSWKPSLIYKHKAMAYQHSLFIINEFISRFDGFTIFWSQSWSKNGVNKSMDKPSYVMDELIN